MDKQQIYDYLEVEFNVSDPSFLTEQDRYIAYERLKHKLLDQNPTPDDYTQSIITLSEYLEL